MIATKQKTLIVPDTLPYEPGHAGSNGNGHAPLVTKKKIGRRRTVADILTKAADALAKRGWIQGEEYVPGQGFCLIGAVAYAVTGRAGAPVPYKDPLFYDAWARVEATLDRQDRGWDPVDWNDQNEVAARRTKRQVVALLRRAAKAAA